MLVETLDFVAHHFPVYLDGLCAGAVNWCELVHDVHIAFKVEVSERATKLLVQKYTFVGAEAGSDSGITDFGRFKVPSVCVFGDEILYFKVFERGGDNRAQRYSGVSGGVKKKRGADVVIQRVCRGCELSSYSL